MKIFVMDGLIMCLSSLVIKYKNLNRIATKY